MTISENKYLGYFNKTEKAVIDALGVFKGTFKKPFAFEIGPYQYRYPSGAFHSSKSFDELIQWITTDSTNKDA